MNLNILTYAIYTMITAFLVLRVGWVFYQNGAHYLHDLFEDDRPTADSLNRLLLLGYYLLNLGYVAFSLSFWPKLTGLVQVIELISERTGLIVLGLGVMHYLNMAWVRLAKRLMKTNKFQIT